MSIYQYVVDPQLSLGIEPMLTNEPRPGASTWAVLSVNLPCEPLVNKDIGPQLTRLSEVRMA